MKIIKYISLLILLLAFSQASNAVDKGSKIVRAYNQGNYSLVLNLAQNQITNQMAGFNTYYYQGLARQAMYKYPEAISSFEQAMFLTTDSLPVNYLLGIVNEKSGNTINAKKHYWLVLDADSTHMAAKSHLANIYKKDKEYVNAMDMFTQLVELDSTNGYFYAQLAYCCKKAGFSEPVTYYYEKAIELNPNDFASVNNLVVQLTVQKYFDQALSLIDTQLIIRPNNIKLLQRKAYIYAISRNYLDAVRGFEKVVALGDSSLFTCKYYGQSLYNNANYEDAAYWLNKYLAAAPNDYQNQLIAGLACQHAYKYDESIKHLDIALDIIYDTKTIARVYTEKGNTLVKLGDYVGFRDSTHTQAALKYKEAVEYFLKAEAIYPENYKIYRTLADLYLDKFEDQKIALYYYEKYYKELDPKTINEYHLEWIQAQISKLKEEVHFLGY